MECTNELFPIQFSTVHITHESYSELENRYRLNSQWRERKCVREREREREEEGERERGREGDRERGREGGREEVCV